MSRNVKPIFIFLSILLFGMAVSACCHLKNDCSKPAMDLSEELALTATVEAIDYDTRHVTLKGPNGNLVTLYVDEDAYNFKEVEVGDLVDIHYHASVAINLEKGSGQTPSVLTGEASTRAPEGQKPQGAVYNVITVRAIVEGIDYENRTVDLKGPRGNVVTVEVDERVKNFKNIKKGDEVTAQYTEAVAIAVRPADKK